jgi:hypothetical protein
MYKFWSDPQPDSLDWLQSPAREITSGKKFDARFLHRCTAIGVSAPRFVPHASARQGSRHRCNRPCPFCWLTTPEYKTLWIVRGTDSRVTAPNPRRMGARS